MKYLAGIFVLILLSGCATWQGIKSDSKKAANWAQDKVHNGAAYVEEKTQ